MPSPPTEPSHSELIAQLENTLRATVADIQSRPVSHASAIESLEMNAMGHTARVYDDTAFAVWQELLQENPDDFQAVHHLALMHHARAFDVEAGRRASHSNADWKQALKYWHWLWKNDEFWEWIGTYSDRRIEPEIVAELRSSWPRKLLQVHCDIAFDPMTRQHRAQFHLQLIRDTEFAAEIKESVLQQTYDNFMANVPMEVWQADMIDADVIRQGAETIEAYLQLDPHSRPALIDALRLQVRVLYGRYNSFIALDESAKDEREQLIDLIERTGHSWLAHFDRLVPLSAELEHDSRDNLSFWYLAMGNVTPLPARAADAIRLFENGMQAALPNSNEYERCRSGHYRAQAYMAREMAAAGRTDAKEYVDALREQENPSLSAKVVLAEAYCILREFPSAIAMCEAGLAQSSAENADEQVVRDALQTTLVSAQEQQRDYDELIEKYGTYEALLVRNKAIDAHNKRDFREAVRLLREALQLSGGTVTMQHDLSDSMTDLIIQQFNAAGESAMGLTDKIIDELVEMANEALAIDPGNDRAGEILRHMMQL